MGMYGWTIFSAKENGLYLLLFRLVFYLCQTCLRNLSNLISSHQNDLFPRTTLGAATIPSKHLRFFSQTGLPVWGSYSLERVACLGRMILTVSPGLHPQSVGSGWSHDFLHLSFICLPLVSHSGSGWSHDFPSLSPVCLSFVSHLSPTLGLVGGMISLPCLPFVFHLSPTCLPLWVWLVA